LSGKKNFVYNHVSPTAGTMPPIVVKDPGLRETLEKDPTAGPRPLSIEEYKRRQARQAEIRRLRPVDPPTTISAELPFLGVEPCPIPREQFPLREASQPTKKSAKRHKKRRGGVRVRLRTEIAKRYAEIVQTEDKARKKILIAELNSLKEDSYRHGLHQKEIRRNKLKPTNYNNFP